VKHLPCLFSDNLKPVIHPFLWPQLYYL